MAVVLQVAHRAGERRAAGHHPLHRQPPVQTTGGPSEHDGAGPAGGDQQRVGVGVQLGQHGGNADQPVPVAHTEHGGAGVALGLDDRPERLRQRPAGLPQERDRPPVTPLRCLGVGEVDQLVRPHRELRLVVSVPVEGEHLVDDHPAGQQHPGVEHHGVHPIQPEQCLWVEHEDVPVGHAHTELGGEGFPAEAGRLGRPGAEHAERPLG